MTYGQRVSFSSAKTFKDSSHNESKLEKFAGEYDPSIKEITQLNKSDLTTVSVLILSNNGDKQILFSTLFRSLEIEQKSKYEKSSIILSIHVF